MLACSTRSYCVRSIKTKTASVSPTKITQLSVWDRVQYRDHVTIALTFRTLPGTSPREVQRHVTKVVDRVSIQRPDLAGRVVLGGPSVSHPSHVSLHTSPGDRIPLSLVGTECFPVPLGWGLQSRAFPSSCFLDARLRLPRLDASHPEAPVTAVKLCFWPAESSFVMLVYLHHSHGDGACMAEFLQLLGAASRELASPVCMPPTPHAWEPRLKLDLPQPISLLSQDFASLLSACPEMQYLTTPPPCLSEPNTARAFTISRPRLFSFISPALAPGTRGPSPFFLISAFLWAWTTLARTTASPSTPTPSTPPTFFNPNNWSTKKTLFSSSPALADQIRHHFSNTVVTATTTLPDADVLRRATHDPRALLAVAEAIAAANDAVDEQFVLTRAALFAKARDVAPLAVVLDPRPAWNFAVNTWAFLGKNVEFPGMPGVVGVGAPAAMRRVQATLGGCPHGREGVGREGVEVMVTVEEGAMGVLLGEEPAFLGFMVGVGW